MLNINELNDKIIATEIAIIQLNESIASIQAQIDNFEYSISESEFEDYLDEEYEDVSILGMSYGAGYALKNLDPVAFRCAKSDYESEFDLDNCTEYTDLVEELESLESDLEDLESDLESLQDELQDLENQDS